MAKSMSSPKVLTNATVTSIYGGKWEKVGISHTKGNKMVTIIKDEDLTMVASSVRPDSKKRIVLPKAVVGEGITYHVYVNNLGQIILDPQVTIPASEAWVFRNKDILASIDKGMTESINGKVIKRGSFAKHVKNAP